jgi:hypothetical protein
MKGINDMSDDQPHKKTCWCEYARCIPVATTSRIVGETTHGNITDVTPFFPTLKMAQDALAKPATTEFIPAEDADWLHKFYAKGTPIEIAHTTKPMGGISMDLVQMYGDMDYPNIKIALAGIHVNRATVKTEPTSSVYCECGTTTYHEIERE